MNPSIDPLTSPRKRLQHKTRNGRYWWVLLIASIVTLLLSQALIHIPKVGFVLLVIGTLLILSSYLAIIVSLYFGIRLIVGRKRRAITQANITRLEELLTKLNKTHRLDDLSKLEAKALSKKLRARLTPAQRDYLGIKPRYGLRILIVSVIFMALVGTSLLSVSYINYLSYITASNQAAQTYEIPPSLLPIVDTLGIDKNVLAKVKIELPQDPTACMANANSTNPVACFRGPNTIIYPIAQLNKTQDAKNSSFAHEYMHYIWSTLSEPEKVALYPLLNQLTAQNPKLAERVKNYHFDAIGGYDELHSYACTEVSDASLPYLLKVHCSRWLPNRSALPSYY